ncbi:MAG: periplasmic heavy metal sensor [Verrucomicrobia bacterium]|nr:periplasmic heavy metal sensor [Verrucomicrobiota bacterium]
MKTNVYAKLTVNVYALGLVLLFASRTLWAQPAPQDPIAESLFPPELLMHHQDAIALSEEQKDFIHAAIQRAEPRIEELRRQLQDESETMAALLKKDRVEEQQALAQADKVLNLEREIKRTHLALLIGIKNKLTPRQQAQLKEIKIKLAPIQMKMQGVQASIRRWEQDGRDLSPIGQIMDEFEPLMREGKFKEAEAVLDRALKRLRE